MVKNRPRPAAPGDIFVLLTPASTLIEENDWQCALQAKYGGSVPQPLHVSLQRFICPDPAQLAAFLDGLQAITSTLLPIPIEGCELQPLYSAFRQNTILKCRILVHEPLCALEDLVLHQMKAHHLEPDFHWHSALITVMEGIENAPAEPTIILPNLLRLFIGQQILISRIVAPGQYQSLRQWQLQQPT